MTTPHQSEGRERGISKLWCFIIGGIVGNLTIPLITKYIVIPLWALFGYE